jgi:DNA-binding transcriptional regulator YhcF (GntR family)
MGALQMTINFDSPTPVYLQIKNQILIGIATKTLEAGDKLPTIRALAAELGINPMTAHKAYTALKAEGVIIADRHSGVRVSANKAVPATAEYKQNLNDELTRLLTAAVLKGMSRAEIITMCGSILNTTVVRQKQKPKDDFEVWL